MNQKLIRSVSLKSQWKIQFAVAAVLSLAFFQMTGCASWLAQPDASFVMRANEICEQEKMQTQRKWKALTTQSSEVNSDEKENFVRNVFIPNSRRQIQKIGDLKIDVPAFSEVANAELQAMTTSADSALTTLENDPALALAEDSAEPLFAAMNTSAEALGLNQRTLDPLS